MPASIQELGHQPRPWGETTDPSVHDPENFRYLVHAIDPFSSMNAMEISLLDARDGVTYDESWGDQKISMYDQPERVAERVSLSMSLIDQKHSATWGEAGLIVEAPEENIVLSSATDAGSHNNNLDFLLNQGRRHGITSGDDLLARTSPRSYNEVVAVANRDGRELRLKGFFYKVTSKGDPVDRLLAQKMQMHADRLGLPVIELPIANKFAGNRVHKTDHKEPNSREKYSSTSIDFNGKRYYVAGHNQYFQFMVADETETRHFAAPHEFEAAITYAVSAGEISQDEAKHTLDKYAEADAKRKVPTAEYDEDGNFKQIVYFEGYGDSEFEITLGKSGHGYRTNTMLSREKARESMLTGFIERDHDTSQHPISTGDADEMVAKATEQLDPFKAAQLQDWYREHKSVLEKQREYHIQRTRSLGGMSLIGGSTHLFDKKPMKIEPTKFVFKNYMLPSDIMRLPKDELGDTDK